MTRYYLDLRYTALELEARPESPILLRLEISHHLRVCHSP